MDTCTCIDTTIIQKVSLLGYTCSGMKGIVHTAFTFTCTITSHVHVQSYLCTITSQYCLLIIE